MVTEMIGATGYIYDENDDMAPVIDAVLRRLGSAEEENTDDDESWIGRAGHRDIEDALKAMMPKEREVLKKFFVEKKTAQDISIEMNMRLDLLGGYIRSAEAQIRVWM